MTDESCLMCNNCKEIYNNIIKLYNVNNYLFSTENFIVNIDSYPVAKDHILIIPRYHYSSFSSIDIDKSDELENIINKILKIFKANDYIMFEHGTNIVDKENKICGNSIFHAHLHIIPNIIIDPQLVAENLKFKKKKQINEYSILKNNSKNFLNTIKYDLPTENNYLLFSNKNNYYCIPEYDIETNIKSQFFRKLLSDIANNGVYNWKDNDDFYNNYNVYKTNIDNTIKDFNNIKDKNVLKTIKTKLVRDNIIDIIKNEGRNVNYYIADNDEEFMYFLRKKLYEEFNEFIESLSIDQKSIKEECADLFEVIENILSLKNLTFDDVFKIKEQKKIKNGSFKKKYILSI